MAPHPGQNDVLLAEDDDDDFLIFSIALSKLPNAFILIRAVNGKELMKALQEKIPDVLFLDMLMPYKDGTECLREIRENPRYDHIPVIICSSLTTNFHVQLAFDQKANAYIYKPSSLSDLKMSLERIFSGDWKNGRQFPAFEQFVLK